MRNTLTRKSVYRLKPKESVCCATQSFLSALATSLFAIRFKSHNISSDKQN